MRKILYCIRILEQYLILEQSKFDKNCLLKSEQCGVYVYTKRNTMSNCQVSHSKLSGVWVNDGLITMNGSGTSIHNNVTGGSSSYYGFYVVFHVLSFTFCLNHLRELFSSTSRLNLSQIATTMGLALIF